MSTPESREQDARDDLIGDAFAELAQVTSHGMCTACGSVEVALVKATGVRDLSGIGESAEYPTGYGCEVCS